MFYANSDIYLQAVYEDMPTVTQVALSDAVSGDGGIAHCTARPAVLAG